MISRLAHTFHVDLTDAERKLADLQRGRTPLDPALRVVGIMPVHVGGFELPPAPADRLHAWHLLPIRLRLDKFSIDRDAFVEVLRSQGVGCSVHWRPLHLHPYYEHTFGGNRMTCRQPAPYGRGW